MTAKVKVTLEKIKLCNIFKNDNIYFSGGTALSYYLSHRISEDIDIISDKPLKYKSIIPNMQALGATKQVDRKSSALRLAGLFPDEYMIKFILDDVKLEFFQANRDIQKEILKEATFAQFEDSDLKILDIKSIAKLKVVALLERNKSRDLFDFYAILENDVLSKDEILYLIKKHKTMSSIEELYIFIKNKHEPKDDETVYLDEENPINLTFDEIKNQVLVSVSNI